MKIRHIFSTIFAVALLSCPMSVCAQKSAYVNTDYVMKRMPDYAQAQQRIDNYVAEWQKELEARYQELESLRANYQKESYLLPENLKKHHEEQLRNKQQEIVDLQQKRFGAGGDLEKKKAELLKPVQDRIFGAIERVANEKGYAFVFDRSASSTVLFASDKYDISGLILEMLGYHGGEAQNGQTPTKETVKKNKR